ncbi:MAG: DUF3556 domain-containing protein, partial [Candidatus Binatia bacterium]
VPGANLTALTAAPLLLAFLLFWLLVVPTAGNLFPSKVSFLLAMRYYAGNWAWSAWMFRGDGHRKLDRVKRVAPLLREQLERYSPADVAGMDSRGTAFRSLHLQGRALGLLLPKAIDDRRFSDYSYYDGEIIAASVLGWNFGEGHLCNEQLLACVQEQCDFEDGELRAVMVESQPLFGSTLHWRIVDAKRGLLEQGYVELSELKRRAPWDYGVS